MNLKVHLLLEIVLAAIICLMATGAYVLFQANRQVRQEAAIALEAVGKQLEVQLLGIDANLQKPKHFPDFDLWKQTHSISGICLSYKSANRESAYGLCQGEALPNKLWPALFDKLYRKIFNPGGELTRHLIFKGQRYGSITVIPSAEMELAKAWNSVTGLLGLSASTAFAVCLLVYFTICRALRPAQLIVSSLKKMQKTDSATRLPPFRLIEWRCIGDAINEFACTQKQLLGERKTLALQLLSVQEEERRYLARELHDELGQCLSAINALSASVMQTAKQDCPHLVPEMESIVCINQRIMETVRSLLVRLRPAELDELGIAACLNAMITDWNKQHSCRSHCQLIIKGDCRSLKEPLSLTLFRIVQESLTNIAKHSTATNVTVALAIAEQKLTLTISDNGKGMADVFPLAKNKGIGLLGVRERVNGLGGTLDLNSSECGGLVVRVTLPMQTNARY